MRAARRGRPQTIKMHVHTQAAPPVGNLRFKRPQPPIPWNIPPHNVTRNATVFGTTTNISTFWHFLSFTSCDYWFNYHPTRMQGTRAHRWELMARQMGALGLRLADSRQLLRIAYSCAFRLFHGRALLLRHVTHPLHMCSPAIYTHRQNVPRVRFCR